jgi:hypothetical protein
MIATQERSKPMTSDTPDSVPEELPPSSPQKSRTSTGPTPSRCSKASRRCASAPACTSARPVSGASTTSSTRSSTTRSTRRSPATTTWST